MFRREINPFHKDSGKTEDVVKHLEEKFDKEKLLCVATVDDYFIYMDFEQFSQAAMMVQTQFMKKE